MSASHESDPCLAAARRRERMQRLAICLFVTIAVLSVADAVADSGHGYTRGFAPAVTGLVAAAWGLLALTVRRPRLRDLAGWTGVVLLLWSGAGVVFDLLRAAALFGVPGFPPELDGLGLARRSAAMLGAVLLAARLMSRQERPAPDLRWGLAAALLAIPYPLLKTYWWAGGSLARELAGNVHAFPVMEVVLFAVAAVWALALVTSWGRVLPRRLLTAGAWVAAVTLVNLGTLAGFGTIADVVGLVDGPFVASGQGLLVGIVYGSWLGLGLCLGHAAWLLGPEGRRGDATVVRQSDPRRGPTVLG